jgi:phage head maturation protease
MTEIEYEVVLFLIHHDVACQLTRSKAKSLERDSEKVTLKFRKHILQGETMEEVIFFFYAGQISDFFFPLSTCYL